jgi:hypothetical protein
MALELEEHVHVPAASGARVVTRTWRIVLATLVAALCLAVIHVSALANGYYQIYYGRFGWGLPEVAFLLHYLLFGSAAVGCLAWALSLGVGDGFARVFDRLEPLSRRATIIIVGASAGATFAAVTLVRYGLLRDTAITDDENAYVFMARVFASGRLYLPSMPAEIRPFFDNQFIINDGKWYGIYFPGHPLVLALGALVGAERWIPSLVTVLTVVMGFLVARRIFGARAAAISALLFPVTVYMVLPSATLLAHSTAALALLTFVYGAIRVGGAPESIRWWIVAAIGLVWAGVTRPLGPAAFAVPWLLWLVVCVRKSGRTRAWAGGLVFSSIGFASIVLFCGYNYTLTGDPFQTGYQRSIELNNHVLLAGRLPAPWPLPTIYEVGHTILRLNFWEFGWPLSLLFVPFFRRTGPGILLLLSSCAVPLAYALIGMTNVYALGPTHYAEIAVFVAILSASGLESLVKRARSWSAGERWSRFVMAVPMVSVFCMLLAFLPIHAASLREMSQITRAPYELVESQGLDRAVVFVHSLPALLVPPGAWVYFHRNPRPDLLDPVLFVRHLGPDRDTQLMRFFPDRKAYIMGMQDGRLIVTPVRP